MVGVNEVQKPEVFVAISERSEVATSAIKGTTQITTIKPNTILLKVRFIMVSISSIT